MDRMTSEQKNLLIKLMEAQFTNIETSLYLNTHPNDKNALALHNDSSEQIMELEKLYERKFGPLKNTSKSRYPWAYIDDPWPWDVDFEPIC